MDDGVTLLGGKEVRVIRKEWKSGSPQPYRKTYNLLPGQSWYKAEITPGKMEHYEQMDIGEQIPVGALIAAELSDDGAHFSVFTEMWAGKFVMVDQYLKCIEPSREAEKIISKLRQENGAKLGGFPDAFGIFPDGHIAFREVKNVSAKDRLGEKQHEFSRLIRKLFGEKADIAVVEWGIPN
jgi:hypothetical protein